MMIVIREERGVNYLEGKPECQEREYSRVIHLLFVNLLVVTRQHDCYDYVIFLYYIILF